MKATRHVRFGLLWVSTAIALAVSGCTQTAVKPVTGRPDIVWPKASEVPRIRFVTAVSVPEDLGIQSSALWKVFEYLSGKPEPHMVTPYGVTLDASGRIYVVDTFLKTVHVFDVEENRYYPFVDNGTPFVSPIDIAIDKKNGVIFITDSKQGIVKVFQDGGKRVAGEIGRGILERPTGVAVNRKTSQLLVVDTVSSNILIFGLRDHKFKGVFGGSDNAGGRLHYPTNIFTAVDGTVLVSDSLNFRIQLFTASGEFLREFGGAGDQPGYFSRPKGVASDSDGNIYVVDSLFDNVQIFNRDGQLLMAFGNHGNGYGEFWLPTGIFIDKKDRIYVSDAYNRRIQIFQYLKQDASK